MDWHILLHGLSAALMLAGALFILTGSFGVWRMPEFFSRLHPASISDSMGMPLLLLGVLLHGDYGVTSVKLLLLLAFAMITSATASHALAKAALHSGMKPMGEVKADIDNIAKQADDA